MKASSLLILPFHSRVYRYDSPPTLSHALLSSLVRVRSRIKTLLLLPLPLSRLINKPPPPPPLIYSLLPLMYSPLPCRPAGRSVTDSPNDSSHAYLPSAREHAGESRTTRGQSSTQCDANIHDIHTTKRTNARRYLQQNICTILGTRSCGWLRQDWF